MAADDENLRALESIIQKEVEERRHKLNCNPDYTKKQVEQKIQDIEHDLRITMMREYERNSIRMSNQIDSRNKEKEFLRKIR
jgi:hypothetical protein